MTHNGIEHPEDTEAVEVAEVLEEPGLGTQEQMMKDPKWNGIPPVGDRPITNRYRFLMLILLVFVVKLIIWGIYRYITGNLDFFTNPESGRENVYWAGMVAKPVLQLLPVVAIWWYVFREKGWPFRLTRKNLFSSIVLGLALGFIYYFVATGVMVGLFNATGMGTDFHFVAGWDDVGWMLIIAMMFSYMIGTGPTEELFSRGFLQDQTARAFDLKFAIVFSAVLFATGHLPISILVYRLPLDTIAWYMAILVVMGIFFSLLYHWSRNIVFPAIIHGLWDWYLSLYALRGAYSEEFMANPGANFGMMDFISTLITLAIMLPIFYIIYLVWWKHDRPLVDGPLAGIVRKIKERKMTVKIRELDRGNWPRRFPVAITAIMVFIFCLASIPVAGLIGTDDEAKFVDRVIGADSDNVKIFDNGTITADGMLTEGSEADVPVAFDDNHIISIQVTLSWTDEGSSRPLYTNQPDEFTVQLLSPEGNVVDETSGDSGNLEFTWSTEDPEAVRYNGSFIVRVRLDDAGDNVGPLGIRPPDEDTSNDYSVNIRYNSYYYTSGSGDDADVRWDA